MRKNSLNEALREYARALAPTHKEREKVQKICSWLPETLDYPCLQIGSYPRYTAITPLHDLDILCILGEWSGGALQTSRVLEAPRELKEKIEKHSSTCPLPIRKVSLQSHSVNITFGDTDQEGFSVDLVPAYSFGKNEFQQDTYKVPELVKYKHGVRRRAFVERMERESRNVNWIDSDPVGYIKIAEEVNRKNSDFRKTVKFIKKWKRSCEDKYKDDFKLKSFHVEQIITADFQSCVGGFDIFDGIFQFFTRLPEAIKEPGIRDRADKRKYIDEYLNDLTTEQREVIRETRDCFLAKMEGARAEATGSIAEDLATACRLRRSGDSEKYLFDCGIPILTERSDFKIDGIIQKKDGFRSGPITEFAEKGIPLGRDREIEFTITKSIDEDCTMWKVQNDKKSSDVPEDQVRGEITKGHTLGQPEHTKYIGAHYVEAFAIKQNVCVARSKVVVNVSA